MEFIITITDPLKLAGITAARVAYNEALPDAFETVEVTPAQPPSEENPEGVPAVTEQRAISPKPGTLATDAEYVQYVADKATESYAVQYAAAIEQAQKDAAFAAKLAATAAA